MLKINADFKTANNSPASLFTKPSITVSTSLFTTLPTICTNITITTNVTTNETMLRYSVLRSKFSTKKSEVTYENSIAPHIPRINAASEASSTTSPFLNPPIAENKRSNAKNNIDIVQWLLIIFFESIKIEIQLN